MGFEDCVWLFRCSRRNRATIRMNFDEAALLWKAVQATAGPVLEIGSYRGGSTVLICEASEDRRVISMDISPQHTRSCREYFEKLPKGKLTLLTQDSRKGLSGETFGLIFIDGDHTYEGVKKDTFTYWPALKSFEGRPPLVLYHDAVPTPRRQYEGIEQFCADLAASGAAKLVGSAGSLLMFEKIKELE